MRIAQIVEGDAPGGTERLVIQIALELRRRGHEVIVIGPAAGPGKGWLGTELRALGFAWETIPKRPMLDPRSVADIMRLLRRHGVDVAHSHEFAPSVFGAIACRLLRRPHVITMHSNLYFAGARRRRMAFRWATVHSSAVVAVSADTRDDVERLLRLPAGSVRVIPNGIAVRKGRGELLRRELALEPGDLLVCAVGNLSPRKNHIQLLNALIQLGRRRPEIPWHLAIAGTDQGSATELREATRRHDVTARLHLLGHRSDTEDVLAAADVFAMSSLHEGMPLAVMEAMFAEKAIVTSTAGGIGEMLTDDVEGLLTPVADEAALSRGLERLLDDGALRARLAAAARRRAEAQFGIAPMIDAYERLYLGRSAS